MPLDTREKGGKRESGEGQEIENDQSTFNTDGPASVTSPVELMSAWCPLNKGAPGSHCQPVHLRGNLFVILELRCNVYDATERVSGVRNL